MSERNQNDVSDKKTGLATASLVCGICGLAYPTILIASIPGIICGHMALGRIKRDPKGYDGRKRAGTGLVMSYLALTIGLILCIVMAAMRASIDSSMQSLQQMGY